MILFINTVIIIMKRYSSSSLLLKRITLSSLSLHNSNIIRFNSSNCNKVIINNINNSNKHNNNRITFGAGISSLLVLLSYTLLNSTSNDNEKITTPLSSPSPLPLDFLIKLKQVLKSDQIEEDEGERDIRAKPWNSYHSCSNKPNIIIFPKSTIDVSNVLKLCNEYKIPVIPFAGGTSIEGQTLTLLGGVSLDFSRMKKVIEFNEADLDITVQAGLGYIELNEKLKSRGLWFPLDPGNDVAIIIIIT